jgi:hypothetical protein
MQGNIFEYWLLAGTASACTAHSCPARCGHAGTCINISRQGRATGGGGVWWEAGAGRGRALGLQLQTLGLGQLVRVRACRRCSGRVFKAFETFYLEYY